MKLGKNYSEANKHYARCSYPEEHSRLIFEWSKLGEEDERDLFIARTVLQ